MSPDEEKTPPMTDVCSPTLKRRQTTDKTDETQKDDESTVKVVYVPRIKWLDLSAQIFIHAGFLYGLYLVFTQAKLLTTIWGERNFFWFTYHYTFSQFQHFNTGIARLVLLYKRIHFLYISFFTVAS